ncbi:molybdenum cofactor guanylyltransferase MobA [Buttiauxella noackiae]|uniref:molybdenum cofactor guanylyltransferase MobA n=1 Tax=Buttiauxella noackiae TaxID=82992 RepID=UPI0028D23D4A|nr:molybdenum cofactor guanylyltransferase MobA [Buttiauxella noackiae]
MRCLTEVTGVVLAGGRATRMGGLDKGLINLNGQPLFEHVMSKLAPQVGSVVISANRNIEIYQSFGIDVLSDTLPDYPGPLAGMLSAMQHLSGEWFLFCPCDTPNIPDDLAYKLWMQKGESYAVWVNDGERDHPTIALMHRKLVTDLEQYLAAGERRVMLFLRKVRGKPILFANQMQNFINVNTPKDLMHREKE